MDLVAQILCRNDDASSTASNIQHYREQILSAFLDSYDAGGRPRFASSLRYRRAAFVVD